jgi:pyridoxine 5-phosphate synthase
MTNRRLYINVDHVATVREARKTDEPDPVEAATLAEAAGADGITVHLREDRRHIQDADVDAMATRISTVLNLELALVPEIIDIACRVRPYQVTLVPERREEITTEGGLDLTADPERVQNGVKRLTEAGIRVSAFIDPDPAAIEAARALAIPAVELHTGRYSQAWRDDQGALQQLRDAASHARSLGLAVHAGHGLTYQNIEPVAQIEAIEEFNIGHSIVSRAIMTGIGAAVAEMVSLVKTGRSYY